MDQEFNPDQQEQIEQQAAPGTTAEVKTTFKPSKAWPTTFIGSLLMTSLVFITILYMPAAMVQQFTELINDTFNIQISEKFTAKQLIRLKFKRNLNDASSIAKKGFLRKKAAFRKLSTKAETRLIDNGFKVDIDPDTRKIKTIQYLDGDVFDSPEKLFKAMDNDPNLRQAVKKTTKGRRGPMWTKAAQSIRAKTGTVFEPLFGNKVDADGKIQSIDDQIDDAAVSKIDADDNDFDQKKVIDDAKEQIDDPDSSIHNNVSDDFDASDVDKLSKGIDDIKVKAKGKVSFKGIAKKAAGILGVAAEGFSKLEEGVAWIRNISFGAKIIKYSSYAGFAGKMLSTIDAFKAGDTTEEQLSGITNKFMKTEPIQNSDGTFCNKQGCPMTKNATDSQFWGIATDNSILGSETQADPVLASHQISHPPKVSQLLEQVNDIPLLNNNGVRMFSNFMNSIGFGIATGVVIVLATILSGGAILPILLAAGGTFLKGFALGVAANVGISALINKFLPELSEGLGITETKSAVSSEEDGESLFTAMASGGNVINSLNSSGNGNLPMAKDLSIAYLKQHKVQLALEAEEIEATHSPLDISTRHTIAGKLVFAMIPYYGRMNSVSGIVGSITNLSKKSLFNLLPTSSAVHAANEDAQIKNSLGLCQDPMIANFTATDGNSKVGLSPFCLPITGLPTEYLENIYFEPSYVLSRFGMAKEDKNKMWQIANDPTLSEEQKIKELDEFVKNDAEINMDDFKKYFRPKDNDGYCRLDEYDTFFLEEEIENKCDDDWWWTINNRLGTAYLVSYRDSCEDRRNELDNFDFDGYLEKSGKELCAHGGTPIADEADNDLFVHKINCLERGRIPWGLDQARPSEEIEKYNQGLASMFGIEEHAASKISDGSECILTGNPYDNNSDNDQYYNHDRELMDYSLYFHQANMQCMLNESNDPAVCQG